MSATRQATMPAAVGITAAALAASALTLGCDDRAEIWEAPIGPPIAVGLNAAAALVDPPAGRVLLLPVAGDLELQPVSLPIGTGFATAAATPNGQRLLVLSRGVVPRQTAEDEPPRLTVIDGAASLQVTANYPLSDPLSSLAVDPASQYAVIYPSAADTSFLLNPNELVVTKLFEGPSATNPFPLTLRSFGGRPQAFTFTDELDVPGGKRRLLVVQTDRDVALVDLDNLDIPEITVKLTGGPEAMVPGGVAVSDGLANADDDARIAIRVQSEPNVVIVDLVPVPAEQAADTPQSYRAMPNIVHVGGAPSDLSFVQTDGGLRLAALVPSAHTLTLVDPATGISSPIALGAPFERISLITNIVGETEHGSDVALLWSSSSQDIAFVALGSTVGQPYKSVDLLQLAHPVIEVRDVPAPNQHLKILTSPYGSGLTVLDLLARTAAPITSSTTGVALQVAPDGGRAWLHASGRQLGQLDLVSLHPRNLLLSNRIHDVFDVARLDGGRALVAVHDVGAVGVTLLDAYNPSLTTAREYAGVLLGGLQ